MCREVACVHDIIKPIVDPPVMQDNDAQVFIIDKLNLFGNFIIIENFIVNLITIYPKNWNRTRKRSEYLSQAFTIGTQKKILIVILANMGKS